MNNTNKPAWPVNVARALALLAVITAATNTGVLTVLFDVFTKDSRISCPNCLVVVYNFLFILTPFIALVGLLLNKIWGYWALFIFPLIAMIFEVSVIPFIGLLINPRAAGWFTLVVVTNLVFIFLVWFLQRKSDQLFR